MVRVPGEVRLRLAVDADVPTLRHWDTKPHVISATGSDDVQDWATEIHGDPGIFEVLIAEEDQRPIGVVQIIDPLLEPSHYWGEVEENLRAIDIWIGEEADLGRGLGTRMMQLALERCFAPSQITAVIIDPLETNTRAHAFYEHLGFVVVGPEVFGQDRCLVHRLTRQRWAALREGS